MTVGQLIKRLLAHDLNQEVMILDSFNGAGMPREINLGPAEQGITQVDADDCADCEDKVGQVVVVLGFGCY